MQTVPVRPSNAPLSIVPGILRFPRLAAARRLKRENTGSCLTVLPRRRLLAGAILLAGRYRAGVERTRHAMLAVCQPRTGKTHAAPRLGGCREARWIGATERRGVWHVSSMIVSGVRCIPDSGSGSLLSRGRPPPAEAEAEAEPRETRRRLSAAGAICSFDISFAGSAIGKLSMMTATDAIASARRAGLDQSCVNRMSR